jgi:hypothetical protein
MSEAATPANAATPPGDEMAVASRPAAAPPDPPPAPTRKRKKVKPQKPVHQVVFHTYPKLLFVWPLILAGLVFWPLVGSWGADAEVIGWVYLLIAGLVLLTLGIDLERDHTVFWAVVFLALFFLGKWLDARFETFTGLGDLYRWFADRNVRYDPALGGTLSLLLLPPYGVMLVYARLQHRWRITNNEFEHYSFGRADDSLARGAKRVRSTFPDLLELLLCGAGTLVVYSATGRTELRRIPHVPMIFLVRRRINRLLETTAVTYAGRQQELYEAEADSEQDEEDAFRSEDTPGPIFREGREPL